MCGWYFFVQKQRSNYWKHCYCGNFKEVECDFYKQEANK